ncbi:UDP-N-acetylmuramate dehydrogenase [Acidithrix ferrooxidans]|uniref:UDP-N-acetylenolpyruvoylglucosamine reductase n=2 Tax=root TaxID=1 RepID=A0A0D8HMH5_9ACTN|nr:UDP-N-acetylmuramate dehydrogenase [Acidithrix ferrooxidans]KJF19054.1 UDP-N-acetylenolpyruvoylglucosamine reductase [Acidithrix ferrooxidans]
MDHHWNFNGLRDALALAGLSIWSDPSLASRTTYRVGGSTAIGVTIGTKEHLLTFYELIRNEGEIPIFVIGNGSNLLVSDSGFSGVALCLGGDFDRIDFEGLSARAGSSVHLPILARRSGGIGLSGFEWAVGVPGSIGGAIRMNAGGHGSTMADSVESIEIYDPNEPLGYKSLSVSQCGFGYRSSGLSPTAVVLGATIRMVEGDPQLSKARISEIVTWRRNNQPGGQNAGSVFVNPPSISAGSLIEQAGLKGFTYRGASVSQKHANFIQAEPGASALDVITLMAKVRDIVDAKFSIRLHSEIRFLGFDETYGLEGLNTVKSH